MNEPLISVIVLVYKTEPYLEQCINSILNQTYRNLEVLLVDDGSPDNCPAMCDAVAHRDGRCRVIHQPNQGQSAARNAALNICTGDYIAFVDSDDWLEPTAYEKMMRMMLENDLDIVCGGIIPIKDGIRYPFRKILLAWVRKPNLIVHLIASGEVVHQRKAQMEANEIDIQNMYMSRVLTCCNHVEDVYTNGRTVEEVAADVFRIIVQRFYGIELSAKE